MLFADEYVLSAHPPLPLHPKVPRPWALDTYSMLYVLVRDMAGTKFLLFVTDRTVGTYLMVLFTQLVLSLLSTFGAFLISCVLV